jgi:hypothetical protein
MVAIMGSSVPGFKKRGKERSKTSGSLRTFVIHYTLIPPEVTMKKLFIASILVTVFASTALFAQFAQLESDFSKLMLLLAR